MPSYGQTTHYCYKIIGYLEWWDKTRDPRYNKSCASIAETKDDSEHVVEQASALVIATSNNGKALKVSTYASNNTWIINSSATKHMNFNSRQVQTLK